MKLFASTDSPRPRTVPAAFSTAASAVVLLCIAAAFALLIGRVAYLQTLGRQRTILQAERQQHLVQTLHARRGSIFDRNGLVMAGTIQRRALFIDPKFMLDVFQEDGKSLVDLDREMARLAFLIDRDPFELSQLVGDKSTSRYVKVADSLDDNVVDAIRKLDLPGIVLEPMDIREYPMGSIASHVLGGMRADGVGLEGVEYQFEKQLRGKDGFKRSLKDARRRAIATAAEDYLPPVNGTHVILSIDSSIQLIAEQELAATCQQFRARAGETIVMDPHTGEILAMANWPTFNPANLEDSRPETRRNRCVTDPYEPGSTIKPFIVGPALAARRTRPTDLFRINGPYKSPLRAKLVTDVHYYGELALWDVVVKSSNIGMVMLSERLGAERLHDAIRSFGFGKATHVDLPGEDPGLVNPLKKWTRPSVVSVAMGYELMVTPLQLVRAAAAYANGGRLVQPTILHGTLDAEGKLQRRQPETAPQAIDATTAQQIRRIMADVVVRGTGQRARSEQWNIFGKTGTAHTARGGSYNESNYTSSFVGGAPFENPRLVVAVVIHDPDKSVAHFGGTVSAPAAKGILERSLAYLQVPPSPLLNPPPAQIAAVLHAFDPELYQRHPPKPGSQVSARE